MMPRALQTFLDPIEKVLAWLVIALVVVVIARHTIWTSPHGPAATAAVEQRAVAKATVARDSLHALGVAIDTQALAPALKRDSSARRELHRVVAAIDTVPSFVDDNPRVALGALETAAMAADTASGVALRVALVRADVAEHEAASADTVATHAVAEATADRAEARSWRLRAAAVAIVSLVVIVLRR